MFVCHLVLSQLAASSSSSEAVRGVHSTWHFTRHPFTLHSNPESCPTGSGRHAASCPPQLFREQGVAILVTSCVFVFSFAYGCAHDSLISSHVLRRP